MIWLDWFYMDLSACGMKGLQELKFDGECFKKVVRYNEHRTKWWRKTCNFASSIDTNISASECSRNLNVLEYSKNNVGYLFRISGVLSWMKTIKFTFIEEFLLGLQLVSLEAIFKMINVFKNQASTYKIFINRLPNWHSIVS